MALFPFGGRSTSLFDPFFSFASSWDPFELLDPSPARTFAENARAIASTRVDWVETDNAHLFKADVPGLTKEDIKVQLLGDRVLEISGERTKEEEQKGDTWHRVERSRGRFLRRFTLPENAKVDAVNAKAENGVLTVTIPKVPKEKPRSSARTIDVV